MKKLVHRPDCPARVERSDSRTPDGRILGVIRCLDCEAVEVVGESEKPLPPGTDEWANAWVEDPARIARTLTAPERSDPNLNPLHPNATSWPPTRPPTFPSF